MSNDDKTSKEIQSNEIHQAKNHIEWCLVNYMSKKEAIDHLFIDKKIDRHLTDLVWQRLEEENPEFFEHYHLRLIVKAQIMEFNRLLSHQADLMSRLGSSAIASMAISNGSNGSHLSNGSPVSNGSHVSTLYQNSTRRTQNPENMQLPLPAPLPNVYSATGPLMHSSMQTALDLSSHSRNLDVTGNMLLAQSSNGGTARGFPEPGYADSLPYEFVSHNNLIEHRALLGDAAVSSFSGIEPNSQPLNGTLLDPDPSSFGYIEHIPQSFGSPDLVADFSNGNDILGSYPRSSFMTPSTHHFHVPHGWRESQGDITRLNSTTESLRSQDLGGK